MSMRRESPRGALQRAPTRNSINCLPAVRGSNSEVGFLGNCDFRMRVETYFSKLGGNYRV